MRYDYHDLNENQFERLVTAICMFFLGQSVQRFCKGPDGGRDGRFHGTANAYPSERAPASGRFIIQAKHTDNPIGKISDPDFSGKSAGSVLSKEIPRIVKLCKAGEVDHYLLYTNRRSGGNAATAAEKRILDQCGVTSVRIFGIESLDDQLKLFPRAGEVADIREYGGALRIFPDDLARVVVALQAELHGKKVRRKKVDLNRENFERKNRRNALSQDAAEMIIGTYLKDFGSIRAFLRTPANADLRKAYEATALTFDAEIAERRAQGASMDSLLNDLCHRLILRDGDLKRNLRLTRTVVYYMYWICDIGRKHDSAQ